MIEKNIDYYKAAKKHTVCQETSLIVEIVICVIILKTSL